MPIQPCSRPELPITPSDPAAREACAIPLVREPIGEAEAPALAQVFKALADPVRLRLVSMIGAHQGGEVCVCDLTDAFDLTQPTISHHLKILREAGIIDSERRGTWVYYRLEPAALERMGALLSAREPPLTVP
jgi:ArsR family transcriptional regulator, arsenate/arsenite/antimonite-responsive transcriptional repressor